MLGISAWELKWIETGSELLTPALLNRAIAAGVLPESARAEMHMRGARAAGWEV